MRRAMSPAPILRFLGGTGTVTGSRFLLDTGRARVLVDCELFQGRKELRLRNRAAFPVDPASIDAVVLTHAYLDHIGFLPAIVRDGFTGPVFCTAFTADLASIVLADSARLQAEDAAYANRKGYSKHRPALPLYTSEDAARAVTQLATVDFGVPVDAAPGVRTVLRPAGHILGSATVALFLDGPQRTLLFRARRTLSPGAAGRLRHFPFGRDDEHWMACMVGKGSGHAEPVVVLGIGPAFTGHREHRIGGAIGDPIVEPVGEVDQRVSGVAAMSDVPFDFESVFVELTGEAFHVTRLEGVAPTELGLPRRGSQHFDQPGGVAPERPDPLGDDRQH